MNKISCYPIFMNFANKTKFDIIMALKSGPMSVMEISSKIGEEQSKVSHNLKTMSCCHLLDVRKQGKKRIYSLNKETVMPILKLAETHIQKHCRGCKK